MSRIVLVDGNSIMNRAFYGIMGSKMLTASDGTYTNAVYGFLAILFKILEDLNPEYIAVAFDLKAPTARHKMYEGYKANRKGMPEELSAQMPIIKDILRLMNITIIEKEGYEADDILGTLSKRFEKDGEDVTILSGDRDTFQLVTDKIVVRIPRTKMGKTEVEDFDRNKVLETYGVEPIQLIEVKGLMGDTSDNIPGVPGVGEKTALSIIQEYKTIDNMYNKIENNEANSIKGKTKEKIVENKDLALLSRTLGTINIEVPIEEKIEDFKVKEWQRPQLLEKFKQLNFNRYIDRFNLKEEGTVTIKQENNLEFEIEESSIDNIINQIKSNKEMIFFVNTKDDLDESKIIKKKLTSISVYLNNKVYYIKIKDINDFKELFESKEIAKIGYKLKELYVILKEQGIELNSIKFDAEIAAYLLSPTASKYPIDVLSKEYLGIDVDEYLEKKNVQKQEEKQINIFESMQNSAEDSNTELNDFEKYDTSLKSYIIYNLKVVLTKKIEEAGQLKLFNEIEMPLLTILAQMQYTGMYIDKNELIEFGETLKSQIEELKQEIYNLVGEEFNINSPKQLGVILFEKLKLTAYKKNRKGYSTDGDVLEKLKVEHPAVGKIIEFRNLVKLNSTYVEGTIPYINTKTNRIHSSFHQTVTATGRISSSEPNLQNIPTRIDLGKQLRKVFKAKVGYVFIDADYSQIELRVLAHISQDEHMLEAFKNGEDIHKQAASKVLGIPIEQVTKEQRSAAKAVNFGIVYGISDFGLAEQLGTSRKKAKEYIQQYLEKYSGIQKFMNEIVEKAKKEGYVETLFNRRRYIPELKSSNYMVRQFGSRVAMNTPIQGTAADIMKIAMIKVKEKLEELKLDAKIVLQVHDELILEASEKDKEKAKHVLKECMESATKLTVPLEVEVTEANNWYDAK